MAAPYPHDVSDAPQPPDSAIGRLLTELSWSGRSIRQYRHGGAGFENVLTAEVLQALDFLPRATFLGGVLDQAHGADEARKTLAEEIEQAEVTVLPGDLELNPAGHGKRTKVIVQSDASSTPSSSRPTTGTRPSAYRSATNGSTTSAPPAARPTTTTSTSTNPSHERPCATGPRPPWTACSPP